VVWNLLANALKFTPEGGRATLRLEACRPASCDAEARILVSDTGQGIRPEFLPYVFDRFRQADSSSTRSHGGLGIGLTIVRHIVELHGGTVHAESKGEGQGSTFRVNLPVKAVRSEGAVAGPQPLAIAENADATADRSSPRTGTHSGDQLDGVRVLVIDDEPDARELISLILTRGGADVVTAASAAEGLQLLGRIRPDVLVSDIAMPDEDGYALIQCVRQLAAGDGGNTPAIALTAYAREEDRRRALSCGYQAHLAKPVEPTQLVSAVAELAHGANGHGDRQPVLKLRYG